MKATITNEKASSILFDGKFYDTNTELELSFSDTFRLGRIANVSAVYGPVDYEPSLFRDGRFFNFFGDIDKQSGFGNVSYYLLKYSREKYNIALAGNTFNVRDTAVFSALQKDLDQRGAMVWHDQPRERWLYSPFKRNVAIVPFETTVIPRSWIGKINGFDALFCPSKQNIEAFRNSGVKVPIELIHWGIDKNLFYPLERPRKDIFTFGHMGALSIRKGTDVLVDAFQAAFPKTQKDVQLICKTSYTHYPFMVHDDRIKVQMTAVPHDELIRDFFQPVDCFVFPTRGEGFGLPALEAMATGLPVIATDWSGIKEFLTDDYGWLLDYSMVPAKNFSEVVYKEECGDWAEPSKDHLVYLMRYVYEHRVETVMKGYAAQNHVKEKWGWADKISMYHEALEKYL